jgi:hypothetical protein
MSQDREVKPTGRGAPLCACPNLEQTIKHTIQTTSWHHRIHVSLHFTFFLFSLRMTRKYASTNHMFSTTVVIRLARRSNLLRYALVPVHRGAGRLHLASTSETTVHRCLPRIWHKIYLLLPFVLCVAPAE